MNPEMCFKVVLFTWNFGYEPKIGFYVNLIFLLLSFWPIANELATPQK